MKLYSRLKLCPQGNRDYSPKKDEMLMQIRQTRKPNESLLWVPFWASDTLLVTWLSYSRRIRVNFYSCTVNTDNLGSYINNIAVLKLFENLVYCSVFRSAIKSDINCVPITVFLWQCPSLAAVLYNVQQRTHKIIIRYRWFFALHRH